MKPFDISAAASLLRTSKSSVLFVSTQLRPREIKMADGLRRLGWKVGLIYYKWTPFDPQAYFDFCAEVSSEDEAHGLARELSPRVTHIFSGAIDAMMLKFCREKPSPVVIDLNDVFAPSLFNYCHDRFEPTQEALALAEGFCARDLQVKSAQRTDNFLLPPRLLLFPEYCWDNSPVRHAPSKDAQANDIHVVSVGTFSLESQGMYDSCYLRLAKLFVEQKIHFHIYPHWAYRRDHHGSRNVNFEKDFADFLAIEKGSPYVHVHESLSTEELAKVLPQYDFGIVSGGCESFGQKLRFYHSAYIRTCYSGRISDYLDAGLPVLINDEVEFDYWLLKRHGACVDLKGILRPKFKQNLLELKHDEQRREILLRARQQFSIKKNSPRLASFYGKIIDSGIGKRTYMRPKNIGSGPTVESSVAASTPTKSVEANTTIGNREKLKTALRNFIQKKAPRLPKILFPYRTIRLFEIHLKNLMQENQIAQADLATLRAQLTKSEHDKTALENQTTGLEQDKRTLTCQVVELRKDKTILENQIADLEQDKKALTSQNVVLQARLETSVKEKGDLSKRVHILSNEKFVLQQEKRWGKVPAHDIAGILNWPEVLNDIERTNGFTDLVRMLGLFSGVTCVSDNPSACWNLLATKNYDQLLTFGYNNFKRTIGHNYFDFLVQKDDPQIQAVEALLSPEIVKRCREMAGSISEDPAFLCSDQFSYKYFVFLLWEYVKRIGSMDQIKELQEPKEGNPITVSWEGQNVSQDLANSLIEYYAISKTMPFERINTVLEIGGGYGRNAYVILTLNPHIKIVLVDIPPAMYVAQRYLSSVFRERRVFKVRNFSSYAEVEKEIEAASIVFLMPHQISLMPPKRFDLSMNISSFGEMGIKQIEWYFSQLKRITDGYFYTKQWRRFNNVFDKTVLNETDYPYPETWRKMYSRPCAVQTEFFEALYQTNNP
ncbi:MAG: putative sugar O-methyltransferase [Candidatus Omnitrophota bacterium]